MFLFWRIGQQVNSEILHHQRAEYGQKIVTTLATQLVASYGRSFESRNLRRMMQFAEQFPDFGIVSALTTQLSWSHVAEVLPLKTAQARLFYLGEAANRQLATRELRRMIDRKAFERKEIANAQLTEASAIALDTFKDPYLLDVLGLRDGFLEADLEAAVLRELESFILELGGGFTFVARQKRMIIGGEDFHLDLLFFHRRLKRLVAVELKIGKFEAGHKGQMELYLGWLNRYERQDGENAPIGLILCAEKSREQIELLQLDQDAIMVAEYWTVFPERPVFERKIHTLLESARTVGTAQSSVVRQKESRRSMRTPLKKKANLIYGEDVLKTTNVADATAVNATLICRFALRARRGRPHHFHGNSESALKGNLMVTYSRMAAPMGLPT